MRIMIFGAAGFIGGQIARAAVNRGWEVHGLRRGVSTGAVGDLPVQWHSGTLTDTAALTRALRGCDVLYHAAGYYPTTHHALRPAMHAAATEMRSVLIAARRGEVPRVVYTSSLSTIGTPPPDAGRLADERDAYLPGSAPSAYYEAKWLMEQEALRTVINGLLPVVTLIPGAVFGPGDVKPTTGELLLRIGQGRVPAAIDVETNFVDGRDVADAHIAAAEYGESGQRYIIGGYNLNVADVIRDAAQIAGVKPPRFTLSRRSASRLMSVARTLRLPISDLLFGLDHFQPLDASKGWKTFGFTPRPFADTLRDTLDWFGNNGYL
jgi:dihydroflavonol-4-reductase